LSPKAKKEYISPKDVSKRQTKKILDFLNSAETAKEIADAVEIPKERDVGINVANNILKARAKVGKFTSLDQVSRVRQVGPERFTEIVQTLKSFSQTKRKERKPIPSVIFPEVFIQRVYPSVVLFEALASNTGCECKRQPCNCLACSCSKGACKGCENWYDRANTYYAEVKWFNKNANTKYNDHAGNSVFNKVEELVLKI
jgi:hypothetical protein